MRESIFAPLFPHWFPDADMVGKVFIVVLSVRGSLFSVCGLCGPFPRSCRGGEGGCRGDEVIAVAPKRDPVYGLERCNGNHEKMIHNSGQSSSPWVVHAPGFFFGGGFGDRTAYSGGTWAAGRPLLSEYGIARLGSTIFFGQIIRG